MRIRATVLLTFALIVGALPVWGQTETPAAPEATVEPEATAAPEVTAEPTPAFQLLIPEVIESYPHDPDSFTQGLVWNDGTFYESAGLYGQSNLREVDLATGEVLRRVDLAPEFFAEGLAQVGDRLIQITWQEETALVYDTETFELVETFNYDTEGWGLCYDGEVLHMSDGTPTLYTRDPETFELLNEVPVTFRGESILNLNELECVDGYVWGNIWQTDLIVRLDPATGVIDRIVDAAGLLTLNQRAQLGEPGAVLNGIAYDDEEEVFYLTGKLWPYLFKVRFVPAPTQ
ncbi:MAG: glutaminyl-peptide cyclotransferase [Anaerolineae bacterium]|jgi:glutaminyl-peptide cyclotransferase|nr:glutaminyl-peptide cyclotransferase [Anaerolineae bacterium]